MSKPDRTQLLQELPALLFRMRQTIREQLPENGKSDPNAWLRSEALSFIVRRSNPTMRDLAVYLHVRAPSATSLVAYLARKQLVRRISEKHDKRIVRIELTAKGKKHVAQYEAKCAELMRSAFSKLSEQELGDLVRVLGRLEDDSRNMV